jgi:mono/diheme cytochrome c family protein
MIGNIITLFALVALVVLFAWFTKRAWGSKHKILKWLALVLAGLLTLLFGLIAVVGAKGIVQLYMPYPVAPAQVTVVGTPDQIARGEHLATVLCASCHSMNGELPLSGGNNLAADTGLPLGDIYPPNITPAGKIKDLSDNDVWRILHTGVESNGRLTFMTVVNSRYMSDEDALAVIAYLRHAPAVQNERPPVNFSFLTALFAGAGLLTFDVPSTIPPVSVTSKGPTKEYGQYVTSFMDCRTCHGPTLSADAPPPAPPAPNLTLIVPKWSKGDFFQAMRTGVDRDGHSISPPMPWKTIGKLDDVELTALYEYLHNLAPIVKAK